MNNILPCEVVRDLMPSYMDGVLSPETTGLVDSHLQECCECRRLYQDASKEVENGKPEIKEITGRTPEIDYLKKVRRRSRRPLIAAVVLLLVLFSSCIYALVPIEFGSAALSSSEKDMLIEQVAKSEITTDYSEYLEDEAFAEAKNFGIKRTGDKGTMYTYLFAGDFVKVKGKAYLRSGASGEAKISFRYTDKGPVLTKVEWADDGDMHEKWVRDNYTGVLWLRDRLYTPYDKNGTNNLEKKLIKKVEKKMGVPVETEDLLEVDLEKGTYEIVRTIEVGMNGDYTFDTETVDKGKLEDLK